MKGRVSERKKEEGYEKGMRSKRNTHTKKSHKGMDRERKDSEKEE